MKRFSNRSRKVFVAQAWAEGMQYMVKFKTIEIFEAPKWLRTLSECTGLALSLSWLGYAGYVSITNHL